MFYVSTIMCSSVGSTARPTDLSKRPGKGGHLASGGRTFQRATCIILPPISVSVNSWTLPKWMWVSVLGRILSNFPSSHLLYADGIKWNSFHLRILSYTCFNSHIPKCYYLLTCIVCALLQNSRQSTNISLF